MLYMYTMYIEDSIVPNDDNSFSIRRYQHLLVVIKIVPYFS